jgi:hypothetical protein
MLALRLHNRVHQVTDRPQVVVARVSYTILENKKLGPQQRVLFCIV